MELFPFAVLLLTPIDSPVRSDSSIIKFVASIISPSAGTLSPDSKITISPKVISLVAITFTFPSLTTLHVGDAIAFSASNDFSVLNSCINPSIAFKNTITHIVMASAVSPINPDITVAANKTHVIKSLNCDKNILIADVLFSLVISFNPYCCCLFLTSELDKPFKTNFSASTTLPPTF